MEIIRVKTQKELDACFNIRLPVFVVEQNVPRDLEIDEFDISPGACHHFLVKEKGQPIATGRWRFYEPGTAKLQRIAVLQDYRGKGVGKKLILALEQDARTEGAVVAILDAQCHAEDFYRSLGYETLSAVPFLDAGIPHVCMRKKLF